MAQNDSMPMEKSMRFFIRMLAAFLARVRPVSSIAKPACIRKTRTAASSVHTVSIARALESASANAASATPRPTSTRTQRLGGCGSFMRQMKQEACQCQEREESQPIRPTPG